MPCFPCNLWRGNQWSQPLALERSLYRFPGYMRPEGTGLMVVHQERVPPQFATDTEGISFTIKLPTIHDSRFAERSPRSRNFLSADDVVNDLVSVQ